MPMGKVIGFSVNVCSKNSWILILREEFLGVDQEEQEKKAKERMAELAKEYPASTHCVYVAGIIGPPAK